MKASTVIANRRRVGRWLFNRPPASGWVAYALPPDHEEDERRPAPDPPPEKKEPVPPRTGRQDTPAPEQNASKASLP